MVQIYKRGKTWTVRFSKRYQVYDPELQKTISKLKQKSKGGFKTKAAANAYGVKLESEALGGVDVTENPIFVEYYKRWYETFRLPNIRTSTQATYSHRYNLLKLYFGDTKVQDVTRAHYQEFLNWYGASHAPGTVRNLHASIKTCAEYAVEDGLISKNFAKMAILTGNKSHMRPASYLSLREIKKLVAACKSKLSPDDIVVCLTLAAIYTGARLGELNGLQWSDIDFDKKTIAIKRTWDAKRFEYRPPKTKKSKRVIPVPDDLLTVFRTLKPNGLKQVFADPVTHYPYNSFEVNERLRAIAKECGINNPAFHFHSLRHSHVAYLLSKGVDVYAISQRLGHANLNITLNTYAYLLKETKEKENKKIVHYLDNL